MAPWQKTVAPFSKHKGGVGSFLKIPRSNSVSNIYFIPRVNCSVMGRMDVPRLSCCAEIARPHKMLVLSVIVRSGHI